MEKTKSQTYYIVSLAVAIGLIFHGTSFLNTLHNTYDLYVHIFFGSHYSESWFDPWEPRWYTGFSLISYPPLVHQLIALLSYPLGLKMGVYVLSFGIVILYVTGAYRFSKLIAVNNESAAYGALIAVFLPSVIETFHVFGQIPMMMGISWLLHAIPEIYAFIKYGKVRHFLCSMSLIAVAVCSHHVTPIFGMVFFVVPLMATAIMDRARDETGSYKKVGIMLFLKYTKKFMPRIVLVGFSTVALTLLMILPYWLWSKNDPITQVPIPHGSRDNFIEVFSSGLVFFIIPWGFLFLMMPFYFFRLFSKRNVFIGFSFIALFILGTGGTTPIPRLLLGENAFNILTLERFTFWATIYAIPLSGEFLWRFTNGDICKMILHRRSKAIHSLYVGILVMTIFFSAGFTTNLNYFRPLQPDPIDITPIKTFLKNDKHYKWRYLTLGFGDQMAWLSSNTDALTIDGNYHSARRIPELTSRAVERLENSKYRGIEGIGTLQQFLESPEKFHLKYIFSNDKFYDPVLYFSGWHRIKLLDNGIMVWERADVSPLSSILPKKEIPHYQKIMWGTVPFLALICVFFINVQLPLIRRLRGKTAYFRINNPEKSREIIEPVFYQVIKYWIVLILVLTMILIANIYFLNIKQLTHERAITSYYDALDSKEYEEAYNMLYVDESLTLDLFMLQISTTDGLLDSYGKINTITHETLMKKPDYAVVKTEIEFITSLKSYRVVKTHEVLKKGWKWYMKPDPSHNYIPTDQYSNVVTNQFINQGRRRITTKETFHQDILDRPVSRIIQANLIKKDSSWHIVGLIQNIDSYPSDITLIATLLDSSNQKITDYYDGYQLTHKLLPKEITGFRIDFRDVEWDLLSDSLKIQPSNFSLEVLGSVATQDLYKKVAIQELTFHDQNLSGRLYNYGNHTSTISQLLTNYYDENDKIRWVDTEWVEKSIFPKKSLEFGFDLLDTEQIVLIDPSDPIVKINGLDNDLITAKYMSGLNDQIDSKFFFANGSLSIHLNNYVGNPTPY